MTSHRDRRGAGSLVRPLLPLALATFAVGTDAFVMAGLLPAIAADLEVSVPAAGQLVTVFALTLAVAAPILSWLLSPLDRRKALQLALVVFVVGNIATALSPTYPLAWPARILTAAGAATITATATSAAVAITPPERRGRAMALVIDGLTLSTALGMPLGNMIGSIDWQSSPAPFGRGRLDSRCRAAASGRPGFSTSRTCWVRSASGRSGS